MFRRKPIHPKPGQPGGRARIMLARAHRMLNNGAFLPAGHLFEELAEGALRRRIPRAPFLFLQSGRGYLYGGEKENGLRIIWRGLNLLRDAGRWRELHRVGERTAEELASQGFEEESGQISDWITSVLPENFEPDTPKEPLGAHGRPVLPTHCPQCGGVVDPSAISWIDRVTGECLYCGSPIRAESGDF